uniref:Uncharacterized protein n=1 Tax=Arundo donax TaxID=35708 RepID=A0A0A9CHN0_ARUDO
MRIRDNIEETQMIRKKHKITYTFGLYKETQSTLSFANIRGIKQRSS